MTTSLPAVSTPDASQPRIIGSRSAGRPTPRSDQISWWLSELARTSTVTQPSGGDGSGRSPTVSAASGSSGFVALAYAARIHRSLLRNQRAGALGAPRL